MDSLDTIDAIDTMDAVSSLLGAASSPVLVPTDANAHATMNATSSVDMDMNMDPHTLLHDSVTGHLLLDMLLLAAVPLVLQFLLSPTSMAEVWKRLRAVLLGNEDEGFVFREIEAKTTYGKYHTQDEHENRHGHLLQQAILTHLTEVLQSKLRGKDVRYEMVDKELEDDAVAETLENNTKTHKPCDMYSDDEDDGTQQYEAINRLRVGAMPKLGEWIEVQPRVFFQQTISSGDENSDRGGNNNNDNNNGGGGGDDKDKSFRGADVTSLFQFKSDAPDGTQRIDKLIEEAFVKYQLLELTKLANDRKKYMYVQTHREAAAASGDDGDGDDDKNATPLVLYKRYALGEEKTFKNLFFDDRVPLVQLLDHFVSKTGKFAIPGFPYKLGLLLHGPPGTGKTSVIKAVAQHTKRHIVTISLGKIQTNQELMDALFDLRFSVEGVALPVNMTFEDVVFVMEDIDCAASVVMARDSKQQQQQLHAAGRSRANRFMRSSRRVTSSNASDKLNLSGLLNVLDGVIDCPGRIVIMTTNHPEKLDPALIRPGRVNKKLELGYMSRTNIQCMIEYYSQSAFTRAQELALDAVVGAPHTKPITPAAVEALCAEFDDIASIVDALALLQSASVDGSGAEAWLS